MTARCYTGIVEIDETYIDGKVKAMPIPNTITETLECALHDNIVRPSVICTDDADGYPRLSVNHSAKEYVNGMASTNGIESVWAVLKHVYCRS